MSSDQPNPQNEQQPAQSRTPRSRWLRRHWLRAAGNQVLASDVIRVSLMAVAVTLSSFAVYQATRASDDAGERFDELRVAQAADSRWASYLGTIVDHDARTMMVFCMATAERDSAMTKLLEGEPNPALIVSSTLRARALRSMVLGDPLARCPSNRGGGGTATQIYEVERAGQLLLGSPAIAAAFSGRAASGELANEVTGLGVAERNLMAASLLLALALGCLIFVEVAGQRGNRPGWLHGPGVSRARRLALLGAGVSGLAGLGILVANAIDRWPMVLLLCAIAGALAGIPVWLRRRRVTAGAVQSARAQPHWWAEALGGVALIAFSLAACGLSVVAIQHREVVAHADALQSESQKLQQVAEQEALRDLASMSLAAELEAKQSAASNTRIRNEKEGSAEFDRQKESEDSLNQQAKDLEEAVREQSHRTGGECPDLVGTTAASPGDLFYDKLGKGDGALLDTDLLRWHLLDRQRSAIACDVATALTRSTARVWAGHTSIFTVALVIIGLAGFMLALAADMDRSRRSSRVLLAIGSAGTALGLLLGSTALPDLVWQRSISSTDAIREGANAIASSYADECGRAARDALERAITVHPDYGPAYALRGRSHYCGASRYGQGYVSSEVSAEVLPDVIADLKEAVKLGPPSPRTSVSLGWALITHGITTKRHAEVIEGIGRTSSAVSTLEQANDTSGSLVPIGRLRRALGLAVLGNRKAALEAYKRAVSCLEPESACPAGGLDDPAQVDEVILGGLADLELIADSVDVEPFRLALMAREVAPTNLETSDLELSLFDQELQITGTDGAPVVWYYRPDTTHTWAVIEAPSRLTAHADWETPLVAAGRVLEVGEYRADVYGDRGRIELTATKASTDNVARFLSRRLGMSMAAPSWWMTHWDDGAEWHAGPSEEEGITLRRIEGVPPMRSTEDYLRAQLADWLKDRSGGKRLASTLKPDEVWFLGYANTLVAELDGLLVAAHLEPYGYRSECGGTLFLASITGDSKGARELVEEVVLDLPQQPPTDRPITLRPGGFAVELPARWGAVPASAKDDYALAGGSCENGGQFSADWPKLDGTLDAVVDADVDGLADTGTDFTLESRETVTVKGALDARLITYTRSRKDGDRVVGWQLSAKDNDGTRLFVAASAPLDDRAEVEAQVRALLRSIEIT